MDRRQIVAFGLAAAIATPALGQQNPVVSPIPAQPQPAESRAGGAFAGPQGAQTDQDRTNRTQAGGSPADTTSAGRRGGASDPAGGGQSAQASPRQNEAATEYIRRSLAVGTLTLQAATFARDKAQHPLVKLFAAAEEGEQNTLMEVLHSLADPATTSGTNIGAARATGSGAPQNPSQAAATAPVMSNEAAALMERMSKAGAGFDREFIDLQIRGHREGLEIQESYLAGNPDRETASIARLARGHIREHLTRLEAIRGELGR